MITPDQRDQFATGGIILGSGAVGGVSGMSAELAAARMAAVLGPCAHPHAGPVDSVITGETLAWLCPTCDTQLPAEWSTERSAP